MQAVTVTSRGLERFRSGHPWVYRSDVAAAPDAPGLYPVKDARGRTLGWAAVNPQSEITLRFLTRGEKPATAELLASRLERAIDYRESLGIDGDAYRVCHGEADGLPGLVIDRYGDYLVVQNGTAAMEPYLDRLLKVLVARLDPRGVLARLEGRARKLEGLPERVFTAHGEVPPLIEAREGRVRYLVDALHGQKTGAFLDQRENRQALASRAGGRALDVFSYHGSFALHLAGRCQSVECIDSSAEALERAEENARLNGLGNMRFTQGNAFDLLRERERAGERYQTISLDPPAFAKAKRDLEAAYGAYKEVNLRCLLLLAPGGILGTASCSYHVSEPDFYLMLRAAAADAGREVRVLERRGQASDHPEVLGVPESRYLKFALLQVVE